MIGELFFGAALALGQAPAAPAVAPRAMPMPILQSLPAVNPMPMPPVTSVPAPVASMPAPSSNGTGATPLSLKEGEKLVPNGDGTYRIENGSAGTAPASDEKKPDEPKPPEKYALMSILEDTWLGKRMDKSGISIYGWTEGSFTASTARRSNSPITTNDFANDFQLNQNYMVISKAVDASKKEFQLGFRADLILPGSDARFTITRGLLDRQLTSGADGGPRRNPIDLYQGYAEIFAPNVGPEGTTVRIGKFATHCEYEVIQAVDTPFLSRSYTFQYNPFTHTGVWSITPLNETWTISNGFAVGSDNFVGNSTNRLMYLGQLKWAPKDGKSTALFNVALTNPKYDTVDAFPIYNTYNMQYTHKFNDKWSYVFDTAFSHMDEIPGVGSANWYGFVNYLTYQWCEKVSSTFRAELFEDSKGVRTGSKGLYTGLTYGVNWSPVKSLLIRPSVRYDHASDSRPFEGKSDLFTATIDAIVRW